MLANILDTLQNSMWSPLRGTRGAVHTFQQSLEVPASATTLAYAVASGSVKQSAALTAPYVLVTCDVDVWVQQGANPTATAPVADTSAGDMRLKAGEQYRVAVSASGNKLAFRAVSTAGTVEITPSA